MTRGIYVEILIRAPMDALWTHTQTPDLHERWDLRFSRIRYLPKSHELEPQRFHYSTRLGFGLEINGGGESVGQQHSTKLIPQAHCRSDLPLTNLNLRAPASQ